MQSNKSNDKKAILQEMQYLIKFAFYMKRYLIIAVSLLAGAVSCKHAVTTPRPTIPLVLNIAGDDSSRLGRLVAEAGSVGKDGSIAIVGEPQDAILLARRFQGADDVDNVDGKPKRDSLPDFAGECFDAILDAANTPFSRYERGHSLDSLREAAVNASLFAWDSTCYRLATDHKALLLKNRAKIVIFTSSLQAANGIFDVDTLLQLTGGNSILLSPTKVLLEDAIAGGAHTIAVWTKPEVKESGAWEAEFARMGNKNVVLSVIAPVNALDVRTRFRDLMRQYQELGRTMDALIIDDYDTDGAPLRSELALIRQGGTAEDAIFDRMLPEGFRFIHAPSAIIGHTYKILREGNLFSHRISRPTVKYYESAESDSGDIVFVEAASSYIHDAYVSKLN